MRIRSLSTHLCFARVALMAGDANVIEQAVQLADDSRDLLSEVARVHGGCRPAREMQCSTAHAIDALPVGRIKFARGMRCGVIVTW
jgi:hypothetical protein